MLLKPRSVNANSNLIHSQFYRILLLIQSKNLNNDVAYSYVAASIYKLF